HGACRRLIELADGVQPVAGFEIAAKRKAGAGQHIAQPRELLVLKPRWRSGGDAFLRLLLVKDVTDIDQHVAANGERQLGLPRRWAFHGGDEERTGVEDRD